MPYDHHAMITWHDATLLLIYRVNNFLWPEETFLMLYGNEYTNQIGISIGKLKEQGNLSQNWNCTLTSDD